MNGQRMNDRSGSNSSVNSNNLNLQNAVSLNSDSIQLRPVTEGFGQSSSVAQPALIGQIRVQNNSSEYMFAVKMKTNNPAEYLVTPSTFYLSPFATQEITFKRRSINNMSNDKFQVLFVKIDRIPSSPPQSNRIDDRLFTPNQPDQQPVNRIMIPVNVIGIISPFKGKNTLKSLVSNNSDNFNKEQQYQQQQQNQQRSYQQQSTTTPWINSVDGTESQLRRRNIELESPYKSTTQASFQQQQQSPQLYNSYGQQAAGIESPYVMTNAQEEAIMKIEYERAVQKVQEYELAVETLGQEIKSAKQEKDKWNQIKNATGITQEAEQFKYEQWHLVLVSLICMFIGVLFAK